jgi:hypothetical protein
VSGQHVEIVVKVTNQGTEIASPFWVDAYINPLHPPTAANQIWNDLCALDPCFGLAWKVEGLDPGASVTLSSADFLPGYSSWPGWMASGTTDIYAYVDTFDPGLEFGAVAESNEANNQAHLGGLTVAGPNPSLSRIRPNTQLKIQPRLLGR